MKTRRVQKLATTRVVVQAGDEACWDPYKLAIQSILREPVPGIEGSDARLEVKLHMKLF
jgi:hypothetical protein